MEPEMIWLEDAVHIKHEPVEIKQEQLDCQLKHEDNIFISEDDYPLNCEVKHEDNVPEDKAAKSEYDNTFILMQPTKIKQQQQDCKLKQGENSCISEDNNPIMVTTSSALSSSGNSRNTSLEIPALHHQQVPGCNVSEMDEDVDQCPYSCDSCNKNFKKLFHLQKHTVIHKDKQSVKSGYISKRSNMEEEKKKKIQLQHSCNICNKLFMKSDTLNRHIRIHTGQRPFSCEICNKSFTERGNLKKHIRTHTGQQQQFSCVICNKTYTECGSLNTHMRSHTGVRPYSCEICNKSFTHRGTLNKHIKTHTGERPFSCEICNKSFTVCASLNTHMRTHTGERPFSCENCKKSFADRGTLVKHMRIHTGERPFSCDTCNKSFSQHGNLKSHMRTHSGQ